MTSDHELFKRLGAAGSAFYGQFDTFREIQRQAIEPVLAGKSILITSATASGKTEALYAPVISRLMQGHRSSRHRIRVLGIAPTRALVNDLFERLQGPLGSLGLSCGRQTSDHSDKHKRPDVLITTPESFDSMLVRNGKYENGTLTGHLLADVEVVVIDEVHLFYGTSRGDQLVWLLARLRRLRAFASQHGYTKTNDLQACGASATVSSPDFVARRLLGDNAEAICVAGSRDIEVLTGDPSAGWTKLSALATISKIRNRLIQSNGLTDLSAIEMHIWRALAVESDVACRKVLVFVPTRSLCDKLSTYLAEHLTRRRDIHVLAHHGSLDKTKREQAEKSFSSARDVVLVATTTLEVGVDIGNVDCIVLVGPPPDTGALLQRIGRGGRRSGITRVVPIARDWIETCALASMLDAAGRGTVDEKPYARRWSVFVQQTASYVAQSKSRSRTRKQLLELADEVWPEQSGNRTAARILDQLIEDEQLVETKGRITLGAEWSESLESRGGGFHHNLDTEGRGTPVVDSSTGEVIAHVQSAGSLGSTMALGGQKWDVVSVGGEIVLKPGNSPKETETFRYAARAAPTSRNFARHFLAGAGFQPEDAPVLMENGKEIWVHAGGSAYELALLQLLPGLKAHPRMKGIALLGIPDIDMVQTVASSPERIRDIIYSNSESMELSLSPGPYHRTLPDDVRREVVLELFGVSQFIEWLSCRRIWSLDVNATLCGSISLESRVP